MEFKKSLWKVWNVSLFNYLVTQKHRPSEERDDIQGHITNFIGKDDVSRCFQLSLYTFRNSNSYEILGYEIDSMYVTKDQLVDLMLPKMNNMFHSKSKKFPCEHGLI